MENNALQKPVTTLRLNNQEFKIPDNASRLMLVRTPQGGWQPSEEIATMGDNDVFVRRDATGQLHLIYKSVKLYHAKKEIDKLGKGDDAPWVITVPGYNKLNQIAGVFIATPQFIIIDGKECANPYVQYENGEIKRIIARKIAIGYSPIGNLVAVDTVRHYNFEAYYLQDLHNKVKWKPLAAKFGTLFVCPFAPEAVVQEMKGGYYVKHDKNVYVFKVIKDFEGIWIDPSNEDIREVYSQHIQHQKFGDVIAQSLAARNALKAHPAIATAQVTVQNGIAEVMVFGFRHGKTQEQFQQMADDIVKGNKPDGVEVHHDEGEETFEQVQEAVVTEAEDGEPVSENALFDKAGEMTAEKPSQPVQQQTATPQEETLQSLFEQAKKLAEEKGANLTIVSRNVCNEKFEKLTADQLKKLIDVLGKIAVPGKQNGGSN